MKLQLVLLFVIVSLLMTSACMQNENSKTQTATKSYPYTDTVRVGMKADTGDNRYALLEYYIRHEDKDRSLLAGSLEVKIGNQNWHVVTYREPIH